MPPIASSNRLISPAVSGYRDNLPAIGKLGTWTRLTGKVRVKVKQREHARRADDWAKKVALAKVQQLPAAQRRADPKFRKAEKETSEQIGKVFAAFATGDERTAGKLCTKLPGLMKPNVNRKTNEKVYGENLREIADYKVKEMTAAELRAVAQGVDGLTHFSSDQPELFALAQAVTRERARRQPQPDTARKACRALGQGQLASCLKGIQAARGDRQRQSLDWKSTMADMKTGELMTVLEQFEPEKNGTPSAATQLLSSMDFISKPPIDTEHPEVGHTSTDMKAIIIAAWDLLTERHKKPPHLHHAEDHVKKAELSGDQAVRTVLRSGFGVEVSNEQKLIFTCGRAGATVDERVCEGLASYNANPAKSKSSKDAYLAASTRVREGINMTAATAKSPFVRPDGTAGSLDGNCKSTYTEETTKDGTLFVKCADVYNNPSFKLSGGSRSQWAPQDVTVSYTLQVAKDGTVTLAEPVRVDYFLEPSRAQNPPAPVRSAPSRPAPMRWRPDPLDESITITPAPPRKLAVLQLTPEEQRHDARRRLGVQADAKPADIARAYEQKLAAAADTAQKEALVAAYDLLRPRLRNAPQEQFAADQFGDALFTAGAQTPFFKALHEFAVKEHSSENTAFCMAAEAFDRIRFRSEEPYRNSWKSYAVDLNLKMPLRQRLETSIRLGNDDSMAEALTEARKEIHNLLRRDTFPRFITAMNANNLPISQVAVDELTNYMRDVRAARSAPR